MLCTCNVHKKMHNDIVLYRNNVIVDREHLIPMAGFWGFFKPTILSRETGASCIQGQVVTCTFVENMYT